MTTIKIQEGHPELITYINEIPSITLRKTSGKVNNKSLKEYLDSLKEILKKYSKNTKTQSNENK
ncbi:hypothetical protein BN863_4580 [Formosa agariphila KMM 3901]|uniref:Uncharacterized protein n=1 Tax=Formosa agariphila (strain DSM 15362 / KCTC 12365 / LMG 23005 / KMM 3901 / M-2Alg 35-1) TaxID=1347342 RepID=T2KH91_FORAG|nr:hypothetical protein BN863_4580 [Formosa agariphila KMM 3901]